MNGIAAKFSTKTILTFYLKSDIKIQVALHAQANPAPKRLLDFCVSLALVRLFEEHYTGKLFRSMFSLRLCRWLHLRPLYNKGVL